VDKSTKRSTCLHPEGRFYDLVLMCRVLWMKSVCLDTFYVHIIIIIIINKLPHKSLTLGLMRCVCVFRARCAEVRLVVTGVCGVCVCPGFAVAHCVSQHSPSPSTPSSGSGSTGRCDSVTASTVSAQSPTGSSHTHTHTHTHTHSIHIPSHTDYGLKCQIKSFWETFNILTLCVCVCVCVCHTSCTYGDDCV